MTRTSAETGAADKIEGLECDLRMAVQVAYRRGAKEWARLNYPQWIEWLESCDAVEGPSVGISRQRNEPTPQPTTGDE